MMGFVLLCLSYGPDGDYCTRFIRSALATVSLSLAQYKLCGFLHREGS